jgi:hypothetical protein
MTTPLLAENVKGKGRHYPHPVTGELLPSITNVLSVINKPALVGWAAREVALKAWELRRSLAEMGEADALQVLKGAPYRKSGRAAERGTTIHAYLEARVRGLEPDVVDGEAKKFQAGAEAWLAEWDPEPLATELTVFADEYAGTGDLWCRRGDRVCIVDFKTGKGIYAEASLQIAALWGAHLTADGGAPPHDLVAEVEGWVVRIGEDGFEAKQVESLEYSLEAFHAALGLWQWQHVESYL